MEYVYSTLILLLIIWIFFSFVISMDNTIEGFKHLCWWQKLAHITSVIVGALFVISALILFVYAIKCIVFG